MKKANTKTFPARAIVKGFGQGSITMLAQTLGKDRVSVASTLRKGTINFNNSYKYTEAINKTFGTNYTRDELFKNS